MTTKTVALATLAATQLMVILDGTVVTVALPAIRDDLGFGDTSLAWVVNGFLLAFALVLLPAGRAGDVFGTRPVFLTGLSIFTLASAWCGLAWDPASLVLARFVQGLGGGIASAVVLGMIAGLYAEPRERLRAFAVLAFIGSVGASVGTVLGGLLTEVASWRWAFLINLPIGIIALVVALRAVAGTPPTGAKGGLLPRALFAEHRFVLGNLLLLSLTFGGFTFQFVTTLYLQDILGFGALTTGLAFLPVSAVIAVASLGFSAALAGRFGSERVMLVGVLGFAAGMLYLVRIPDSGSFVLDVLPGTVVMGLGFGIAMPQATALVMGALAPELSGIGSGLTTTTQQAGGFLGTLIAAGLVATVGYHAAYASAAIALALGAAVAAYLLVKAPRGHDPKVTEHVVEEAATI
ncbi:MFS transporter [Nocardioides albus]|uniref:MFS family permease n=1 Tax=Nocardioides albus TaxID=1841 RepID=A0A7W5F6Y0_9ACTN|nr:MFS transporter [Nocardioides albus]MBB3087595.1 MFS family permease [Nocardioides albus]GGU10140.1 MFS transporter [Nocardioides albus]